MMEQKEKWARFISILQADVIPATGCTEPVSLAFAAAVAARRLGQPVERVEAKVSANLMKNGMGVMVPGTGRTGLYIAAAVGSLGGNPDRGLEVLEGIGPDEIAAAKEMVDTGKVTVSVAEVDNILYAEAVVWHGTHFVKAAIADSHTNLVCIEEDGVSVLKADGAATDPGSEKNAFLQSCTAREIYDFAVHADYESIRFIKKAAEINDRLSEEGLTGKYGLTLANALKEKIAKGFIGDDLQSKVTIATVAASDARMGGAKLPAMTNSGSGNQGITATEPVCVVARHVGADEEMMIRALILSHMMAIYIHSHLPKLSALCAVATAAMGAAAGMAWLLDEKQRFETVSHALSTMTGDLIGMACDGAANSCAMKVGTAVSSAFRAVMLALDNIRITGDEGLVANGVDESIRNIGKLACIGMRETDVEILNIMMTKNREEGILS